MSVGGRGRAGWRLGAPGDSCGILNAKPTLPFMVNGRALQKCEQRRGEKVLVGSRVGGKGRR